MSTPPTSDTTTSASAGRTDGMGPEPARARRNIALTRARAISILGLRGPAAVALLILIAVPLIYSITLSFRDYSLLIPGSAGKWIGFDNYARMFHDGAFGAALLRTGLFIVASVVPETIIGIAMAVGLNQLRRYQRLATTALLTPMVIAPLVVGLIFNLAFNSQFGIFTWVIKTLGGPTTGILDSSQTAFGALVLSDVWEWTPFVALMIMAALKALPHSPLEAARVDGASRFATFWHITLPYLRPVLAVAVLFRVTEALREFDKVFILTNGGPGEATTVNDLFQYRVSFHEYDLSYGATLGLATFALVMTLAWIMYRRMVRKES